MNAPIDILTPKLIKLISIRRQIQELTDQLKEEVEKEKPLVPDSATIRVPGHGTVTVVADSGSVSVDERKALMSILDVTSKDDIEAALVAFGVDVPVKVRVTARHIRINPNVKKKSKKKVA